jgi:hypothetical protein
MCSATAYLAILANKIYPIGNRNTYKMAKDQLPFQANGYKTITILFLAVININRRFIYSCIPLSSLYAFNNEVLLREEDYQGK